MRFFLRIRTPVDGSILPALSLWITPFSSGTTGITVSIEPSNNMTVSYLNNFILIQELNTYENHKYLIENT